MSRTKSLVAGIMFTVGMMGASCAYPSVAVDSDKAVVIDGVIAQGNILPLGKDLLERAERGDKEVHMIINSPGGEVITGFLFLNMMEEAKSKGLKVTCFVPTVAASMAYQILLHCDERYTLEHAFLLWHRARVNVGGFGSAPMTSTDLLTLGNDLLKMDNMIFSKVLSTMGGEVSLKTLMYHFERETLHSGLNLSLMAPKFIQSHLYIKGLMSTLLDQKVPRNQLLGRNALKNADIIYISDEIK